MKTWAKVKLWSSRETQAQKSKCCNSWNCVPHAMKIQSIPFNGQVKLSRFSFRWDSRLVRRLHPMFDGERESAEDQGEKSMQSYSRIFAHRERERERTATIVVYIHGEKAEVSMILKQEACGWKERRHPRKQEASYLLPT